MARTKQTARKSTNGRAPRRVVVQKVRGYGTPVSQGPSEEDQDEQKLKDSLDKVSLGDLKAHLTAYKLPATGLRKALQLRLFNHMKENGITDLPDLPQPSTSTTKKPTAKTNKKKPKKIIDDSSSESESEPEPEPESEPDASSEEELDESEEENEDGEVVWQWADDSATGSQDLWRDYSAALQTKLTNAYQKNQKKVRVDTQRFVDLSQTPYLQKRYDDPSRRRLVQRLVKPTSSTKKAKAKAKPKATTSASKKAKKQEEPEESSSDIDIEVESDSESSNDSGGEEELAAEWMWAGDSPGGGHQVS